MKMLLEKSNKLLFYYSTMRIIFSLFIAFQQYSGIINSIIKAESASLKNSIAAWELEITECAHAQTLVQSEKKDLGGKKQNR